MNDQHLSKIVLANMIKEAREVIFELPVFGFYVKLASLVLQNNSLHIKFTQKDLAEILDYTAPTIYRYLRDLAQMGFIEMYSWNGAFTIVSLLVKKNEDTIVNAYLDRIDQVYVNMRRTCIEMFDEEVLPFESKTAKV